MKKNVLRAGNRIITPFLIGNHTVSYICGDTGIPYETYKECARKNKTGSIAVGITETGGLVQVDRVTKL